MTKWNRLSLGFGVLLALVGSVVYAEDKVTKNKVQGGFLNCVYKEADGKEAGYVLFVPYDYKADKPSPLILFLHGSGESGDDGKKQATVGLGLAIRKREKTFPFITVFPQSQKRNWRAGSADANRALAIVAEVQQKYNVDPKRVYLTGLSMGGFGTWSLAAESPERWAAIAPICGGGNPKQAAALKDVPCWCFHGGADRTVPPRLSHDMMKALWDAGASPNYTEYPGVGHNSWDKAYATADLYEWFLAHKLK